MNQLYVKGSLRKETLEIEERSGRRRGKWTNPTAMSITRRDSFGCCASLIENAPRTHIAGEEILVSPVAVPPSSHFADYHALAVGVSFDS